MSGNGDHPRDKRLNLYIDAAQRLRQGEYDLRLPRDTQDDLGRLGIALQDLAQDLEQRRRELQQLEQITSNINAGLLLDDILDKVYDDFRQIIPYNRIGFSLITADGERVRARWAKSDRSDIKLTVGYEGPLAGSSLQRIMQTGQPRILNDLEAYLAEKPDSESTRLIVEEGYRSSLTCPLVVNGYPVGFMFFSSVRPNTYSDVHVAVFQRIAEQLSIIVDKGQLVSELAGRQSAIEQQNQELKRLNELKNAFVGMAAHDLRNPIAFIHMIADLLLHPLGDMTEADQRTLYQDILDQSSHMLDMLSDLLDVTEIESGTLHLRREQIDMRAFLDKAVDRHAQLARRKNTRVLLATASEGAATADPDRLRQVVDNLITNAVKFSPPGSTVQVSAIHSAAGWKVSVQDEGPGITAADREHLFQEFARLSARPTGGERSTGLGLAITRRMVEAHGGQIGVESEPGHGATFWFTLPG